MTNKSLRFKLHASRRMAERGISIIDVRTVLYYGKEIPSEKGKYGPTFEKRYFIRGHEVKVVYAKSPGWLEIITVMWVYEEKNK